MDYQSICFIRIANLYNTHTWSCRKNIRTSASSTVNNHTNHQHLPANHNNQ